MTTFHYCFNSILDHLHTYNLYFSFGVIIILFHLSEKTVQVPTTNISTAPYLKTIILKMGVVHLKLTVERRNTVKISYMQL